MSVDFKTMRSILRGINEAGAYTNLTPAQRAKKIADDGAARAAAAKKPGADEVAAPVDAKGGMDSAALKTNQAAARAKTADMEDKFSKGQISKDELESHYKSNPAQGKEATAIAQKRDSVSDDEAGTMRDRADKAATVAGVAAGGAGLGRLALKTAAGQAAKAAVAKGAETAGGFAKGASTAIKGGEKASDMASGALGAGKGPGEKAGFEAGMKVKDTAANVADKAKTLGNDIKDAAAARPVATGAGAAAATIAGANALKTATSGSGSDTAATPRSSEVATSKDDRTKPVKSIPSTATARAPTPVPRPNGSALPPPHPANVAASLAPADGGAKKPNPYDNMGDDNASFFQADRKAQQQGLVKGPNNPKKGVSVATEMVAMLDALNNSNNPNMFSEISKGKLKDYVAASDEDSSRGSKLSNAMHAGDKKAEHKVGNRLDGSHTAKNKIAGKNVKVAATNEGTEEERHYKIGKGAKGYYVNQASSNGDWHHSVQTGYHKTEGDARSWVKNHAGKSPHKITHLPSMKEEVEQVDELSSKTVADYQKKKIDKEGPFMDKKNFDKFKVGSKKLLGKAKVNATEEVEEIEEISKEKLERYVSKASKDGRDALSDRNAARNSRNAINDPDNKIVKKVEADSDRRYGKRVSGVGRALDKLAKEETELFSDAEIAHFMKVNGEEE